MNKYIICFALLQLLSIIVSTLKYSVTGTAKPWVATIINAASCAIGNWATIELVKQDTTVGVVITFILTLVGVPLARLLIDKCTKDKLFVFTATIECNNDEAATIRQELKENHDIHSNYISIVEEQLYQFTIYSRSKQDSLFIKKLLKDLLHAKYHVIECH